MINRGNSHQFFDHIEENLDIRFSKSKDLIAEYIASSYSEEDLNKRGMTPLCGDFMSILCIDIMSVMSTYLLYSQEYFRSYEANNSSKNHKFEGLLKIKDSKEALMRVENNLIPRLFSILRDTSSGFISVNKWRMEGRSTEDILKKIDSDNLMDFKKEIDELVKEKVKERSIELSNFLKALKFWSTSNGNFLSKEEFLQWKQENPEEKYQFYELDFVPSFSEIILVLSNITVMSLKRFTDSLNDKMQIPDKYKISSIPDFDKLCDDIALSAQTAAINSSLEHMDL